MATCVREKVRPSSAVTWIKFALLGIILSVCVQGAFSATEPTESECRPYIEKALKEQHLEGDEIALEKTEARDFHEHKEESAGISDDKDGGERATDDGDDVDVKSEDDDDDDDDGDEKTEEHEGDTEEDNDEDHQDEQDETSVEKGEVESAEGTDAGDDNDNAGDDDNTKEKTDNHDDDDNEHDNNQKSEEKQTEETDDKDKNDEDDDDGEDDSLERPINIEVQEIQLDDDDDDDDENLGDDNNEGDHKAEDVKSAEDLQDSKSAERDDVVMDKDGDDDGDKSDEKPQTSIEQDKQPEDEDDKSQEKEVEVKDDESEKFEKREAKTTEAAAPEERTEPEDSGASEEQTAAPEEEELINEVVIPDNLRPRDHIDKILRLEEDSGLEKILEKTTDSTLKSLKGLYDNAIKPLEMLYKYRDLSNRHFGDPEIFSKPLILFMGPWSGGKSSTINYLLNNEFSQTSLRTGAEPSPAYFNILMYGEEEEILDGTQLAADWTFSGLQKFGQGLLDRLKGVKLPNKLLEKVNVVEIPGILEIRKQVQRLFPFNDACQWFIDRADIIFLVYDPSKLDVGPETEAILDQLKGRESQTRIILNKADQVKPEELMRVQGTLIWNISPLMSSTEPPIMYSTSLWSMPYEVGAPTRLLLAQERAFLRDLREAIDKRVENKISSARRFAVRVRNHAKMVDCYLTTYYNHKSFFGNRKRISDDIIQNPQKYHIYEGLSTLTNISRYDLPDPDVYQDFFKINPLYEFKKLSETCTYFRGCPINKLDVVIAYDLPELVGKYRKVVEAAREQLQKENS